MPTIHADCEYQASFFTLAALISVSFFGIRQYFRENDAPGLQLKREHMTVKFFL